MNRKKKQPSLNEWKVRKDMFTGFIVLLLMLSMCDARAQSEMVWAFGNGAGLHLGNNTGPLRTALTHGRYREAAASVCDRQGNLLFYSEGDTVWNRYGEVMPSGANITGHPPFISGGNAFSPTTSTWQGAQIVPVPNRPEQFYLFSLTSYEFGDSSGKLYYSLIDMSLDGGRGDVVSGERGVLIDSGLAEQMVAAVGSNCNYWLIVVPKNDNNSNGNQFKAYEVTAGGVQQRPVVSDVGGVYLGGFLGKLTVSPNSRRIALARVALGGFMLVGGPVELYNFDPSTGIITADMVLGAYAINNPIYQGICFSPDNDRLYGLRYNYGMPVLLDQWDLSSNNVGTILASRLVLDSVSTGSDIRRGGDKLYYVTDSIHLGVIHYPDLTGPSCQAESQAIQLLPGTTNGLRLPSAVPVIQPDSASAYRYLDATCFSSGELLVPADTTGWGYLWSTGDTGSMFNAVLSGQYRVQYYTEPCIKHVDTFEVEFSHGRLPELHVQAACRGDSNGRAYASTYPGDPVAYTYVWLQGTDTLSLADTLAGVPSGRYQLHISTTTGCDTVLPFELAEEDVRAAFALSDTLICLGETISFFNVSDSHFTAFEWGFGNGEFTQAFEPSAYLYAYPGAYVVRLVAEGNSCFDTVYQQVYVDPPPSPYFEANPREVCVGQPVYFSPEADHTVQGLQWFVEGQRVDQQGPESRYAYAFDSGGVFPVSLTLLPRACPDTTATRVLEVFPYPEVDLGPDSSICLNGQPVYLQNLRPAPSASYRQVWSTGDTTEVLKVVHPGTYSLRVTAEPLGCSTTETITISKDCYIDIPNAFSPNGDGHNDYFLPRSLLSESLLGFRMQVFNRWGQLIFDTTRPDGRGWDGTFNGRAQPAGVYLYRIEAAFGNGREEKYEGNVTLVR